MKLRVKDTIESERRWISENDSFQFPNAPPSPTCVLDQLATVALVNPKKHVGMPVVQAKKSTHGMMTGQGRANDEPHPQLALCSQSHENIYVYQGFHACIVSYI